MTEEQKEKYANFLDKVSEILGLNKPVDILRLCAVTDEYLRPIEKRIADLEWQLKEITEDNDYWQKENEELKKENASLKAYNEKLLTSEMNKQNELCDTLIKCKRLEKENEEAKEIIKDLLGCLYSVEYDHVSDLEQAEQFINSEVEK